MYSFTTERLVHASRDRVWNVIADVANYHKVAPNIGDVKILSGEGVGMRRACADHQGRTWQETCTVWEPGKSYTFVVDTKAANYPYPLSVMEGTWGVKEARAGESIITLTFRYDVKYPQPIKWFLNSLYIRHQFRTICKQLLNNWEKEILAGH